MLPAVLAECSQGVPSDLSLDLFGDPVSGVVDQSGHGRSAVVYGSASITSEGTAFNGVSDYATIANFEYATDATFSVSLWVKKASCTGHMYEYLYSHQHETGPTWDTSSYVLLMFACEESGGGVSSAGGSVIRYDVQDEQRHRATFDGRLYNASDFDAITDVWLHTILTVSPSSMKTYADGTRVQDATHGFYTLQFGSLSNNAVGTPGNSHPSR